MEKLLLFIGWHSLALGYFCYPYSDFCNDHSEFADSIRLTKAVQTEAIPAPDHLNRNTPMRLALRFFVSRKAARTFSIVVVVLIFCTFAPTIISAVLKSFCSKAILKDWHLFLRYEFYGMNSVLNAFIYGMRHVKYRKSFRKMWFRVANFFKDTS